MNPTSSVYDDPNLKSARANYESANKEATASEAAGYTLPDQLKSALTAKFSQDNPLIQARESALKNYLNETTAGRLSVTHTSAGGTAPVVLNPLQQADLIQRRRSNVLAPLTTANDLLGMETGGMADIINATARAQQGQTARLQGKAKLAGESYTNILNELSAKAEEAWKQKSFDEQVRQFNVSQASSGGGGTAGERSENNARSALKRDISRNVTFSELYNRYGAELPEYEIREAYNSGPMAKKWGAAKETSAELISGMKNVKMGKLNEPTQIDTYKSFSSGLDRLEGQYNNLSRIDKITAVIPGADRVNSKLNAINTLKAELGYKLARMRDMGVLNKQDVEYAIGSLGKIVATNESAMASLNEVRQSINRALEIKGGSKENKSTSNITQSDGTVWKQNSDGSYTRIK